MTDTETCEYEACEEAETDHRCRGIGHWAAVAWGRRDVAGGRRCQSCVRHRSRPVSRFSRTDLDTSSVLGQRPRGIPRTASSCTHRASKMPRQRRLLIAPQKHISRRHTCSQCSSYWITCNYAVSPCSNFDTIATDLQKICNKETQLSYTQVINKYGNL